MSPDQGSVEHALADYRSRVPDHDRRPLGYGAPVSSPVVRPALAAEIGTPLDDLIAEGEAQRKAPVGSGRFADTAPAKLGTFLAAATHSPTYRILSSHGVKKPGLIIDKCRDANLAVAAGVAVLQMETGIPQHNIFGCDYGSRSSAPYCHQDVTHDRIAALLRQSLNNGVGWTQLTYRPFVVQANARSGGAEAPKNQVHVGFHLLGGLVHSYGLWGGFEHYNGAASYANAAMALYNRWHAILN